MIFFTDNIFRHCNTSEDLLLVHYSQDMNCTEWFFSLVTPLDIAIPQWTCCWSTVQLPGRCLLLHCSLLLFGQALALAACDNQPGRVILKTSIRIVAWILNCSAIIHGFSVKISSNFWLKCTHATVPQQFSPQWLEDQQAVDCEETWHRRRCSSQRSKLLETLKSVNLSPL